MKKINYFGYGSNMLTQRLTPRCKSATPIGTAFVTGYRIVFAKRSKDGSGKAMLEATGNPDDVVHGVLFEIDEEQCADLDEHEGVGNGYLRADAFAVTRSETGERMLATTYIAEDAYIDRTLKPYEWYYALVLAGALQHGLPDDYTAKLKDVAFAFDPTPRRRTRLEALEALKAAGYEELLPAKEPAEEPDRVPRRNAARPFF